VPHVIPPTVTRDDEFFWQGVAESRLLLARCARCANLQHPPSPMCPVCGSLEWTVQEASGRGTVHSWIVSRHPSDPDELPRVVALVELEEGVRLVSNLQDVGPDRVTNDMAVELLFREVDDVTLPQFRPAGSGGA
jgi:3-oxo-4,17-pregnadiene-20-carboxyl-CoA hydratase alpha subunit